MIDENELYCSERGRKKPFLKKVTLNELLAQNNMQNSF